MGHWTIKLCTQTGRQQGFFVPTQLHYGQWSSFFHSVCQVWLSHWPSAQKVSLLATVHGCETGFLGLKEQTSSSFPRPLRHTSACKSQQYSDQHKFFSQKPHQSKGATPKHGMSVFWKRWIMFWGFKMWLVGDRFLPHKIILAWGCKQWLLYNNNNV